MRRILKNHKGLTMMEVLLTVALLAIVIVPCLSSFVVAQRGNVLAAQTRNEYAKAQNLMEDLKATEAPDGGTWTDAVAAKIKEAAEDSNDGISIYSSVTNDYYVVEIYVGEHGSESKPESLTEDQLILKGVIVP